MDEVHNKELYQLALDHFNEPVLIEDQLGRLVGYGESAVDCYLIINFLRGKISWHTCVGGYYWLDRLKGQEYVRSNNGEDWDDLTRLNSLLELNGAPKAKEFLLKLEHDDFENGC